MESFGRIENEPTKKLEVKRKYFFCHNCFIYLARTRLASKTRTAAKFIYLDKLLRYQIVVVSTILIYVACR